MMGRITVKAMMAVALLIANTAVYASCNSINWNRSGTFPGNNSYVNSGTNLAQVDAFADHSLSVFGSNCGNSHCGQTARVTVSGACRLNGNNNDQQDEASTGGCGDQRVSPWVSTKAGNVSGGTSKCVITLHADHNGGSTSQTRTIRLNQQIVWNSVPTPQWVGGPTYQVTALGKTSDGLGNSGIGVSYTSLTTGVCTISGNTVTNVGAGTCRIRASAGSNDNFKAAPNKNHEWAVSTPTDTDNDGHNILVDNCPTVHNPGQENNDGDSQGDACDNDDDNDGDPDNADNCQFIANSNQANHDGDSQGDVCDDDDDNDNVTDILEGLEGTNPKNNSSFPDADNDGTPDTQESDADNDGVANNSEPGGNPYIDADNDGIPKYWDDNDNNAGVGNANGVVEAAFNPRGGLPAFRHAGYSNANSTRVYVRHNATGANNGSSWDDAYTDLRTAVEFARISGDEVWIAQGTYYPTSTTNVNIRFNLRAGVSYIGGFYGTEVSTDQANRRLYPTVLSGDIGKDDTNVVKGVTPTEGDIVGNNTRAIVAFENQGNSAANNITLQGVIITGGLISDNWVGSGLHLWRSYATIKDVVLQGNRSTRGGAISVEENVTAAFENMMVFNNKSTKTADRDGGGGMLLLGGGNGPIQVTMTKSLFTNNESANGGGAITVKKNGSAHAVKLDMTNVTLVNNTAQHWGGALGIEDGAEVTCNYCTVAENSVNAAGSWERTIAIGDNGKLALARSYIAFKDKGSAPHGWAIRTYNNVTITDNGYNSIGVGTEPGVYHNGSGNGYGAAFGSGTTTTNANTVDQEINKAIGSDGGLTQTVPVRDGSSLKDAIPAGQCGSTLVDQRGYARPSGNGCDIGAFEYTDANGICWDDGAITRSSPAMGGQQVFCAATNGVNPADLINNLVTGSAGTGLLVLLATGLFVRRRKQAAI